MAAGPRGNWIMTFQPKISPQNLCCYIAKQISTLFPDRDILPSALSSFIQIALDRLENCLTHTPLKHFTNDGVTVFNHLNTDQYAIFLYFLCNSISRENGDPILSEKVYALNKALHGIDIYYEVNMPEIFTLVHCVGTVIGRGCFSDYLCVYQGCTIGGNLDLEYPTIKKGVVLYAGSNVIGNSTINENCFISASTQIINQDVPANTIVYGTSPDTVFKPTQRHVVKDVFKVQTP
tara:strand:- start:3413 stop:4117 length:705 start_codon:yes stop_codon:yes gene_type:complete